MTNPYRANLDRIGAAMRQAARENMYSVFPDQRLLEDSGYAMNYVLGSEEAVFNSEIDDKITELMERIMHESGEVSND